MMQRGDVQMWEKVKASNPSMGVCEISAAIGRLWRELGPEDKQRHNDEYTLDKVLSCSTCVPAQLAFRAVKSDILSY